MSNVPCSRIFNMWLLQVKGTTINVIMLHYPMLHYAMGALQLISHQWQTLQTVCPSRSPSPA